MLIEVAICAFRRPEILETINTVAAQDLPDGARLRVIVAENDDQPALRDSIEGHARKIGIDLKYVHAPARNISIARNACLDAASGDVLIFIDDDEFADPNWITAMVAVWQDSGAGVVFGPVKAIYPPQAPEWMRANDFHSASPVNNRGVVETGYCGNALLDRRDPRVAPMRFDLAFGRTGGEDTDFFFRLHRSGVVMATAHNAVVREMVPPSRLRFWWLMRRKHSSGAHYGSCIAPGMSKRAGTFALALTKMIYCGARAVAASFDRERCSFWILRGAFHAGVISGCISAPRREVYGS